jgi:S1-C subfamily serine protease
VLRVSVVEAAGRPADIATGFASGDGRAFTVQHVLSISRPAVVTAPGGRPGRARVLRVDARADLALLAVAGLRAPPLRVGSASAGDRVTVRVLRDGHVRALPARVRRVITARVHAASGGSPQTRPALELAAAVVKGDSGAPVLDDHARVVGVVFAEAHDRDGVAYAVASSALP